MDPTGVTLIGQAAESFVRLKWMEFFFQIAAAVACLALFGAVVISCIRETQDKD
jgi:hypothetical protein